MRVTELVRIIPETLWAARFDLARDFYGYCSISQAISITMSEADEFERQILRVAQGQEFGKWLGDIFKPLDKAVRLKIVNEKSKAYGLGAKSWLRIYAVRLNFDFFVISGSAIKLTKSMNERPHLKEELKKLDMLVKFLKELNIETVEDWGYIDFE